MKKELGSTVKNHTRNLIPTPKIESLKCKKTHIVMYIHVVY